MGPDNCGVRSQWLKRLVPFSAKWGVFVQLAYYPPYHSKYNPIERVFGVLEILGWRSLAHDRGCNKGRAFGLEWVAQAKIFEERVESADEGQRKGVEQRGKKQGRAGEAFLGMVEEFE